MPKINPNFKVVPDLEGPKLNLKESLVDSSKLQNDYYQNAKKLAQLEKGQLNKQTQTKSSVSSKVVKSLKKGKTPLELLKKTKIKARVGGMLTLGTNTIHEISRAYRNDLKDGKFHELPRTVLGEGVGWFFGSLGAGLSGGASLGILSELGGLAAYTLGKNVGYHLIDDQTQFVRESWDLFDQHFEQDKKADLSAALKRGISLSVGPLMGPYFYFHGADVLESK